MKNVAFRSPRYESGPNMTPLVDVVMVILIFLMLAGNFASGEHFLASKTPPVPAGVGGQGINPARQLDVYLTCPPGGPFTARANAFGTVHSTDALATALAAQRQRYADAGTPADDVLVVLHPGANAPWGPVATSYDAAVRAEFKKIVFAWAE